MHFLKHQHFLLPRESICQKVTCYRCLPAPSRNRNKIQTATPVFKVKLSNETGDNALRSHREWQIQYGGRQTGNTYIYKLADQLGTRLQLFFSCNYFHTADPTSKPGHFHSCLSNLMNIDQVPRFRTSKY